MNNTYHALDKKQWNEVLRKCISLAKSQEANLIGLNLKQVVALKLYTDCDELQREFQMCFREENKTERERRQKQFYFWNKFLEDACMKSPHIITEKLYHGINDQSLSSSTFSGTYYGMY